MTDDDKQSIDKVRSKLIAKIKAGSSPASALRGIEFKSLVDQLKTLKQDKKAEFGKALNALRKEIEAHNSSSLDNIKLPPIDVTAPFDVNTKEQDRILLGASVGSIHPITKETEKILDIGYRLGFKSMETYEIDDDYHMFGSLNFPEGHPARDDFDTFTTKQKDKSSKPYVAPAHTSTMQLRALTKDLDKLKAGQPIAYFIPGRVFRNEDLDAVHEHTFYQLEGVYVGKDVTVANLMATLKEFMSAYYDKDVEIKSQPFYFPFTEPSFEFAISCPYCNKKGCKVCSYSGWIELLGCGMIHPNVLKNAGIDPNIYTGFAWGIGFMRMTMIKYGIEDIRHFLSGHLDFLRQFK